MEIYWPNLLDREHPESFWLHEYITHGRCINEFQSQMDYFETAINITLGIRDVLRMPLSTTGSLYLRYNFFLSFWNSQFTIEKR